MAIIAAKKAKGTQMNDAVNWGNTTDRAALITQCVELPRLCPLERTEFGKTSLIYTQMTAPEESANEAMNPASGKIRK
jgi:hypothetical protein